MGSRVMRFLVDNWIPDSIDKRSGRMMTDIFISYASEDRAIAQRLGRELNTETPWKAFWDRNIEPGAQWNSEIQRSLREARCVIVLWSEDSRKSFWVRGEAADSYERDTYLPVQIDRTTPPRLFKHIQALSMVKWAAQGDAEELNALKSAIATRIGQLPMYGNLDKVAPDDPVTAAHLHLVHSCWRVDKTTDFGLMPYQIHLIVYGHHSALDRVESVEYRLPGYPPPHDFQHGGPAERLFELKELANGFSIAQAHVQLRSQPPGHPKVIRLSRFINTSESGPRLFDSFIRRVPRA
jgi:hypothetical protein